MKDGKIGTCTLGPTISSTGYPEVNQYQGGVRHVPNLALAMQDPAKWGSNAADFVIRPLEEYANNSVGFAEMAVNNDVAGGTMNRVCPGKDLALLIGSTFFTMFDKSKWQTLDSIAFKGVTPFMKGGFKLTRSDSPWRSDSPRPP